MHQKNLPDLETLPAKMRLHPTVQHAYQESAQETHEHVASSLDADRLRQLCFDAGADDVGFVSLTRPELDDQRSDILEHAPFARSLISFVCRMNREPVRFVWLSARQEKMS